MIELNVHRKKAAHKMIWTYDLHGCQMDESLQYVWVFELTLNNQVIYLEGKYLENMCTLT